MATFLIGLVAETAEGADAPAALKFRAAKAFSTARARYEASPTNSEAAWQLGRATYDWADYATADSEKEEIAQVGIAACRKLIQRETNSAPGHYYLAMDLGQLAETKTLGALKLVLEMEVEFKLALALDAQFDFAGPDRNLGLLYWQAPGWPTSIGNRAKARDHLQQACKLAPEYPENWLNLIEAEFKWGERSAAVADFKKLGPVWQAAPEKFKGPDWEASWLDWKSRMEILKKKAVQAAKLAEPPHKFSE